MKTKVLTHNMLSKKYIIIIIIILIVTILFGRNSFFNMTLISIIFDHLKYHYLIGSRDKHMLPDVKDKPVLTITLDLLAVKTNEISSNKLFFSY